MILYTTQEVAILLKVSTRTVQRAAHRIHKKKGTIRAVRFTENDIKRMVGVSTHA